LPRDLKIIFLSVGVTLKQAIERVLEVENFNKQKNFNTTKNKKFEHKFDKKYKPEKKLEEIKCYKCNKMGHYANSCTTSKKMNNVKMFKEIDSRIDMQEIFLNDRRFTVLFDTGASDSLIPEKYLTLLQNVKIWKEEMKFKNYTGESWTSKGYVILEIEYEQKTIFEKFWIAGGKANDIVIAFETVKLLKENAELPVVCKINTGKNQPISWTRPIRSFKDKNEFENLCSELEQKGIIKKSTSDWLNPVVLVRKKTGELRFCIDLRKLNDMVATEVFELPRISKIFLHVRNMKCFSVVDLKDGFFQIKINPVDREKTTFSTGSRLMQFRRMPQGYKNSSSNFSVR
jgi:hypothetical protein